MPYLPGHPIVPPVVPSDVESKPFGVISAAPYGSSAILTIPWAYIKMMGPKGLRKASQVSQACFASSEMNDSAKVV